MGKVTITVTKQEIEQAVSDYLDRKITVNGRKQLQEPSFHFTNKDGEIGYFECSVEATLQPTPTKTGGSDNDRN